MTQIYDLQQRADVLRKKTATDSISPEEVGGLHADTLAYIANMERYASSLGIKKVYTSVSEMNGDESPVSSTGMPLKAGQLVTIFNAEAPDAENSGEIYAFQNPGWVLVGRLDAGTADTLKKLIEGDKATVSDNNRNAFVWLGNFETWAEAQTEIDKLHATGEDNTKVGEFRLLLNGRNLIVRNFVQNWATGVFTQTVQGSIQWNVETQTMDQSLNIKTYERRYNEGTGWTTWEEGTAKIELAQKLSTEEGSEKKPISQKAVSEAINSCIKGSNLVGVMSFDENKFLSNMLDPQQWVIGSYYDAKGEINSNPNFSCVELDVSELIGKELYITIKNSGSSYCGFKTTDGNFIDFWWNTTELKTFIKTVPLNADKLLLSTSNTEKENAKLFINVSQYIQVQIDETVEPVKDVVSELALDSFGTFPFIKWQKGFIYNLSGSTAVNNNYEIAEIDVSKLRGKKLIINSYNYAASYCGFKKEDGTFFNTWSNATEIKEITKLVPDDAVLLLLSNSLSNSNPYVKLDLSLEEKDSVWKGKNWYAYGTSLTNLGYYVNRANSKLGAILTNKGVNGGGIISNTQIKNAVMNTDDGKLDADLITLEVCANDLNSLLGDIYDIDNSSFCGALNQCIRYLQENTNAQIVILSSTPPRYDRLNPDTKYTPEHTYDNGKTFYDFVKAIREVAEINQCYFFQLGLGLGVSRMNVNNLYISDNIHHTQLGGENIGDGLYEFLKNVPLWN